MTVGLGISSLNGSMTLTNAKSLESEPFVGFEAKKTTRSRSRLMLKPMFEAKAQPQAKLRP